MGGLCVKGLPLREALRQVFIGQGTPRRLGRQTRLNAFQGGLQVNAGGLFLKEFYGTGNRNRAAAKGQDGRIFRIASHRLLQRLLFQAAETFLSVRGKNGGNGAPSFLYDNLVQIQERTAKRLSQEPPHRSFSGGHEAC